MKILALTPDKTVIVDGQPHQLDLNLGTRVWALQWDTLLGRGEVEYADGTPNSIITALVPPFENVVTTVENYLATIPPSPLHVLVDGKWVVDPAKARAAKEAEIRAGGNRRLQALATPYASAERETWDTQQREARAYLADSSAVVPMLSAMAEARGITTAEMVAKVLENVALFETESGQILGQQQALLVQLKAISEEDPYAVEKINAISWG